MHDKSNELNYDTITLEVSGINSLNFLEKMREVVVGNTTYSYIYANGGSKNARYSNCSFIPITTINKDDTMNNYLYQEKDYKPKYEDLLALIKTQKQTNNHYKDLFTGYYSSGLLNAENYHVYFANEKIKSEFVQRILNSYYNYGLCTRVAFKGIKTGEVNVKVYILIKTNSFILLSGNFNK